MRVSRRIAATLLVVVNVGVAVYALSQHRGYADLLLEAAGDFAHSSA